VCQASSRKTAELVGKERQKKQKTGAKRPSPDESRRNRGPKSSTIAIIDPPGSLFNTFDWLHTIVVANTIDPSLNPYFKCLHKKTTNCRIISTKKKNIHKGQKKVSPLLNNLSLYLSI
jgi:hypothetical protein